jgi:Tfp pilus assembly PilM family ATPase
VSFVEAEERKRSAGAGQAGYQDILRAHHSSYERAFQEFAQVIREYERTTGESVALVHMAGSAVAFPGLRQELENALKIPVQSANPFAKVAYPAFMEDTITAIGPTFTVALGAALRAFE